MPGKIQAVREINQKQTAHPKKPQKPRLQLIQPALQPVPKASHDFLKGGVVTFSTPQRNLVFQAQDEAEDRTAGYYCIPPFRWERLRYDLLTQADHGWEPLPDPMLARVRYLQRLNASNPFDFYRIELCDKSILATAERENLLKNLYPFLVYILTHEMVHMVRLSSILDNQPEMPVSCTESEEQRVQRISRRILTGSSHFHPVLDKFCS
jgi:hypothetical protein